MIKVQRFTFNPFQENTYVLWNNENEAAIIDPGCYFPQEEEALQNFISEAGLTPVMLLNTHCHLDHVFGNRWVYKTFGLELRLHRLEEKVLQYAPEAGKMYGVNFSNYEGPLHFLEEGETVLLGSEQLDVILAPGHSPGSICFHHKNQPILIAGDVLFYESIGRTDLPGGNHEQLISSIKMKLFNLPGQTVVHCGHGPSTTIGHEKENNPFLY